MTPRTMNGRRSYRQCMLARSTGNPTTALGPAWCRMLLPPSMVAPVQAVCRSFPWCCPYSTASARLHAHWTACWRKRVRVRWRLSWWMTGQLTERRLYCLGMAFPVVFTSVSNAHARVAPCLPPRYEKLNSCVRVITHAQNRGVAASLNAGIAACRGTLVARMDADDVCAPDRLAVQARWLAEHPHVDVVGAAVVIDSPKGLRVKQLPCHPMWLRWSMLFYCAVAHPTTLARREVMWTFLAGLRLHARLTLWVLGHSSSRQQVATPKASGVLRTTTCGSELCTPRRRDLLPRQVALAVTRALELYARHSQVPAPCDVWLASRRRWCACASTVRVWGGRILACFPVPAASHCGWVIVAGPAGGNVSTTRSTEQAREALHACHRAVCRALGRDVPFRCVQCFVQGSEAILTPADASSERSDDAARAVGHVRAAVELLRDLAAVVVATTPGGVYSHCDRAAAVAVRKDAQRRAAELGTAAVATWGIAGLPVIAAWKEMQTP